MKFFSTMKNESGVLSIGGIRVDKLEKEYGTPIYIMDQQLIEENMKSYKESFKSSKFDTQVVYAFKAFLAKAMYQLVEKYDLDIDAVSAGELYTIKANGKSSYAWEQQDVGRVGDVFRLWSWKYNNR